TLAGGSLAAVWGRRRWPVVRPLPEPPRTYAGSAFHGRRALSRYRIQGRGPGFVRRDVVAAGTRRGGGIRRYSKNGIPSALGGVFGLLHLRHDVTRSAGEPAFYRRRRVGRALRGARPRRCAQRATRKAGPP